MMRTFWPFNIDPLVSRSYFLSRTSEYRPRNIDIDLKKIKLVVILRSPSPSPLRRSSSSSACERIGCRQPVNLYQLEVDTTLSAGAGLFYVRIPSWSVFRKQFFIPPKFSPDIFVPLKFSMEIFAPLNLFSVPLIST